MNLADIARPCEWDILYVICGFTREELAIIAINREYGKEWKNKQYASALNISLRTYNRRLSKIKTKIKQSGIQI